MNFSAPQSADETNMTPGGLVAGQGPAWAARLHRAAGAWRALAGAAVVLLALVGGSGAAQAHDSLEGTSPVTGSTVATMPGAVKLTMSNTPAALGAQVKVLDASGSNWAVGPVSVLDNVATQNVKPGAPAGKYTVDWRLVSSDSHPVEGTFTFTAKAAAGAAAGPAQSGQQVSEAAAPPVADSGGIPWSVVGLIGVLVVVVVAMIVVARRRLGEAD